MASGISWVIENIELHNYLLEWLQANGENVTVTVPIDFYKTTYENLDKDNCVFIGSINTAKKLMKLGWRNIWLSDNFKFSVYRQAIENHLLNKDAWAYTVDFVLKYWDHLLTDTPQLFIRPDDYNKVFPGMVIHKDNKAGFVDALAFYQLTNMSTIAYLSPVKTIEYEYRIVCVNNKVITGSQYMHRGNIAVSSYTDTRRVRSFLEPLLYNLSDALDSLIYIVDVGVLDTGDMGIVEVNSFSTSGLYKCNPDKIVKAVAKLILN